MSWFEKLLPKVSTAKKKGVPEGIWSQCESCQAILYRAELENNLDVCVKCNHHMRISWSEALRFIFRSRKPCRIRSINCSLKIG